MSSKLIYPVYLLCVVTLLVSCKQTQQHNSKITAKNITIDSTIATTKSIDELVSPYKQELNKEMSQVYSYTPKTIVKNDGVLQSSLGNLLADLCYKTTDSIYNKQTGNNIDFAMFNYGGIRAIIPAGNVTKERAFKLMPFENELVVVTLSGKKTLELINYFIKNKKAHPLSKQVNLAIKGNYFSLQIHKKPFDINKTYNVLTSDYLQTGGDNMVFFKEPVKLTKLNYKFRDAIINYFQKTDTLKPTIDNRVILE